MATTAGIKIGGFSEGHLLKRAQEIVIQKAEGSEMFDSESEDRIPKFEQSGTYFRVCVAFDIAFDTRLSPQYTYAELTIGRVLGRGGFCVVSEITKVVLKANSKNDIVASNGTEANKRPGAANNNVDEYHIANIVQDRKFMHTHCIRNDKDARYAIKILRPDVVKDPHTFVNGVVDLAIEARFLAGM